MKKLVIEFSNERLITPSGLSLVGQILGKSSFVIFHLISSHYFEMGYKLG